MGIAKPFRVLCLDGGGMRGVYQATYLDTFAQRLRVSDTGEIDPGRAFDLLVGTSTGGIVACALAAGIPLGKVLALYQVHGREIFPRQRLRAVPKLGKYVRGLFSGLAAGDQALRAVLTDAFGTETMGQVYAGSTPILRTLPLSPILGKRSVYVQAQALQPGVQARAG